MHLARETGREIAAATVDHNLRSESAAEAKGVARQCAGLGVPHEILTWQEVPKGNLQSAARDARIALLSEWAERRGLVGVALGHTLDDQAETVLMRLARGSGVDGLSGMAARRRAGETLWLRPLLGVSRLELRDYLEAKNVNWVEDPSNDDPGFDRVKARQALDVLAPLGITASGLVETSARMARARSALETATLALARDAATVDAAGCVTLSVDSLCQAEEEIALRLLAHSLCWVSGQPYRPRMSSLTRLHKAVQNNEKTTLHGVEVVSNQREVTLSREASATGAPVRVGEVWDSRWVVAGDGGGQVRALGQEGLISLPDWRDVTRSRTAAITTPAVWDGQELRAAPCLGLKNGYNARHVSGQAGYFDTILSG